MLILGIYYGHNATASIMRDGEIVACVSEERFNGKKNYLGFPKNAITYVLSEAKVSAGDIDLVTISHIFGVPMKFYTLDKHHGFFSLSVLSLLYYPLRPLRSLWGAITDTFPSLSFIGRGLYRLLMQTVGRYTNWKERKYIARYLGIPQEKVHAFDHHLSHAASAYYASPFNNEKALVLTLDGEGDLCSGSASVFEKDRSRMLTKISRESSFGYLYAYLTVFLGMKPNEHEYKVMGLAAYSKEDDVEKVFREIQHIVTLDKKRLTFVTTFNFTDAQRFFEKRTRHIRFDILAGAVQLLLERRIVAWVEEVVKRTGVHTVILSGGVFMNVKLNQRIAGSSHVNELFILPSCGDESSILGSSYLAYINFSKKTKKTYGIPQLRHVYLGPSFSGREILSAVKHFRSLKKYTVRKVIGVENEIARLLSEGHIVARVAGRMEFGARALGNRSILADPRDLSVVRIINEQIKNRDFWMPFAASILKERARDYLVNPKNIDSPYMMITFDTTEKGKEDLAAAMHQSDLTTRPQILTKEQNPSYYKIIKEFEKITGVGAVLNTSFNLHGYPIVLGPKEALRAFEESGLTHLVLENYLITKRKPRR